jgi:hypothetical protein
MVMATACAHAALKCAAGMVVQRQPSVATAAPHSIGRSVLVGGQAANARAHVKGVHRLIAMVTACVQAALQTATAAGV